MSIWNSGLCGPAGRNRTPERNGGTCRNGKPYQNGTAYQSEDVYFRFTRETLTNASDNAQIELTEAQAQQTKVNTLLNLMTQAPTEQLRKDLCELLDWDYDELKDKFPDNPEEALQTAQTALNEVQTVE